MTIAKESTWRCFISNGTAARTNLKVSIKLNFSVDNLGKEGNKVGYLTYIIL